MAQRNRPAESSSPSGTTVTLTTEQWDEVVGIMTQGTQVILSQLAMQQGGLPQVAQLSTKANTLIEAIQQQLEK
jgi:hypothetical protein